MTHAEGDRHGHGHGHDAAALLDMARQLQINAVIASSSGRSPSLRIDLWHLSMLKKYPGSMERAIALS
jgi:hypothetical protein